MMSRIVLLLLLTFFCVCEGDNGTSDPCQAFGGAFTGIWQWESAFGICKFGIISKNYIYSENVGMEIKKSGRDDNDVHCVWEDEVLTGTCSNSSLSIQGGGDMQFSGMITPAPIKIMLRGTAGTQSEFIDLDKK